MDRRDSIRSLLLGGVATGLVLQGCKTEETGEKPMSSQSDEAGGGYGRIPEELERDKMLRESVFFTSGEMAMISILVDIILPSDDKSGSATDAGVPDFLEFIAKDMPQHQVKLRGGLMWLQHEANVRFGKIFPECTREQQISIIDDIAYPDNVKPEYSQGVKFFSLLRDLTMTGFYTTKIGIDDLGYVGNTPNVWDGVPEDVLKKHGLAYDNEWLAKCINQETRATEPVWDEQGNLIG